LKAVPPENRSRDRDLDCTLLLFRGHLDRNAAFHLANVDLPAAAVALDDFQLSVQIAIQIGKPDVDRHRIC